MVRVEKKERKPRLRLIREKGYLHLLPGSGGGDRITLDVENRKSLWWEGEEKKNSSPMEQKPLL